MFLFYLQDVSCIIYYVYCIYIWIWNKLSWSLALLSLAAARFAKMQEIQFLFNFYSVALLKNTGSQNYYFCLYIWFKKKNCPTKPLHHWSVPMNRECNCDIFWVMNKKVSVLQRPDQSLHSHKESMTEQTHPPRTNERDQC